MVNVEMTTI